MNKQRRLSDCLKYAFCMLVLASGVPGGRAWADEVDAQAEQINESEVEQPDIRDRFPYTFDDVSGNLVLIKCNGRDGAWSGSGFVAVMDGETYIFINQHLILGADSISFKTAQGEALRPRAVELAATRDIARLLLEDREGLSISDTLSMGAPIAVFGNSPGGEVAGELYGEVTGVGAELVEVSAEFVAENSGSPVLNQDMEVIGIASYVRTSQPSRMKEGTQFENKVRRFCYRLNKVRWTRVNWKKYNREYGMAYRETEAMVESIITVVNGLYDEPFGRVAESYTDVTLARWSTQHNRAINTSGSQRRTEVDKSTKALSDFCKRRARSLKLKLENHNMTEFLRDESEGYMYSFQYASEAIDYFNTKLPAL